MEAEEYPRIYLYQRIVRAKLFIDNNYAQAIDIDNIADEAHFSKFHFIRLFKTIYGKTPHKYLTSVRLENAIKLFRQGKPVSDVCFLVGFESLSSFSGLFKSNTGLSPSAYLTRQIQLKQQVLKTPFKFIPRCYAYQNGWIEDY